MRLVPGGAVFAAGGTIVCAGFTHGFFTLLSFMRIENEDSGRSIGIPTAFYAGGAHGKTGGRCETRPPSLIS